MKVKILEYKEDPSLSSSSGNNAADFVEQQIACEYLLTKNSDETTTVRIASSSSPKVPLYHQIWESPTRMMQHLFLPIGYPHSVDPSYLPYQLYDGLQGLCSYWRGVVSTKAVFEAAGVGNAEATAMSAALNWALRDGTGMIGGLVYSYICSPYFDSHPLEFRLLLADVINDIALTLDMVAPYFVDPMYVLSLSTMFKTICGITAGATKGRITHHFARHNGNMADLSAKESTQETLVSLLGMAGGVFVAKILEKQDSAFWTWILFGALTLLHVWANYRAVTTIKLTTINPERTKALFRDLVTVLAQQVRQSTSNENTVQEAVIVTALENLQTPDDIKESFLSSTWNLLYPTIHVARPLDDFSKLVDCTLWMTDLEPQVSEMPYIIGYGGGTTIYLWLSVGATLQHEIQAYVHALLLQELLAARKTHDGAVAPLPFNVDLISRTMTAIKFLVGSTSTKGRSSATLLRLLAKKSWDVESRSYLGFSSRRLGFVGSLKKD